MWNILRYKTVDSTNEELRRLIQSGVREGSVVVADEQTAGRGRQGRSWFSPAGENIYLSLLLTPRLPLESPSSITLVMGVAIAEALEELCDLPVQLKWPNDLQIHGRKVGGILSELEIPSEELPRLIVGIGLNVNIQKNELPTDIFDLATSLAIESRTVWLRDKIMKHVLSHIEGAYHDFITRGFSFFQPRYLRRSALEGKHIAITENGECLTGMVCGVDENGLLQLQLDVKEKSASTLYKVLSGEVHVISY